MKALPWVSGEAKMGQKPKAAFSAVIPRHLGAANTPSLSPGLPHVLSQGSSPPQHGVGAAREPRGPLDPGPHLKQPPRAVEEALSAQAGRHLPGS